MFLLKKKTLVNKLTQLFKIRNKNCFVKNAKKSLSLYKDLRFTKKDTLIH